MKVNVVKLEGTGNTARIIHIPVDTLNVLRIEIEVDGCTYQIQCGETTCYYRDTSLRVTCERGIVVKPITSNVIEIL